MAVAYTRSPFKLDSQWFTVVQGLMKPPHTITEVHRTPYVKEKLTLMSFIREYRK